MDNENQWHFIVDDEGGRRQEGPVSQEDLEAMLSAGKLSTDSLVWQEGMAEWVQLGAVPDFSEPAGEDSTPPVPDSEPAETSAVEPPVDEAEGEESSDAMKIRDFANHTILFSKSRNVLLIATNDYHAGPLVLSKLDLLGFLTAMETSAQ